MGIWHFTNKMVEKETNPSGPKTDLRLKNTVAKGYLLTLSLESFQKGYFFGFGNLYTPLYSYTFYNVGEHVCACDLNCWPLRNVTATIDCGSTKQHVQ